MINRTSILEEILAEALRNEGFQYERQYSVYERTGDLSPKYTLDFLIRAGKKLIDVECDGDTYHNNPQKQKADEYRNAWLIENGYWPVRFDTIDIKYNINFCTNTIKKIISSHTDQEFSLKPENPKIEGYRNGGEADYVENISNDKKTNKVAIYAAYHALSYEKNVKGAIAFKLYDQIRDRSSDEFVLVYSNVNTKLCQSLSVYEALRKIKKPSALTIYTNSKWLVSVCNGNRLSEASKNMDDVGLFNRIENELNKHNFIFKLVKKSNGIYDVGHYQSLVSRARQKLQQVPENERIEYIPI